jgi:hypothetical protein
VGLEGGLGLKAIKGEGEVVGGVLEAVEMHLDEGKFSTPEQGFDEREALR